MPHPRAKEVRADHAWIVPFVAAVFAMFTIQLSNLGFSPLLPDIQRQFHLDFSQVGLFTGVYGIMGILLSIPAGLLARRLGEGPVLAGALFLVAAGLCCLAASQGFVTALSSRALWLCGFRIAFVCVMVAVAVAAPAPMKSLSMGVLGAVSGLASLIGSPFGAFIGARFGWRVGFLAYACMALLGGAAVLLLYVRRSGVRAPTAGTRGLEETPLDQAEPARQLTVWSMAVTIGLINMGGFTMTFFSPSVLRTVFHTGPREPALLLSAAYGCGMLANLLFGFIADRTDRLLTLIGMAVLLVVAACTLGSSSERVFAGSVIALISLGLAATNQGYALVGASHFSRNPGPAMGVVSLGSGVYAYVGPQLFGLLRDRAGTFAAGFHVLVAASCLSLLILAGLKMYLHRQEEQVPVAAAGPQ